MDGILFRQQISYCTIDESKAGQRCPEKRRQDFRFEHRSRSYRNVDIIQTSLVAGRLHAVFFVRIARSEPEKRKKHLNPTLLQRRRKSSDLRLRPHEAWSAYPSPDSGSVATESATAARYRDSIPCDEMSRLFNKQAFHAKTKSKLTLIHVRQQPSPPLTTIRAPAGVGATLVSHGQA